MDPLLARYFQHARLGQQANMPADGDFLDVGQAPGQGDKWSWPGAARSAWDDWNVQDQVAELATSVVYDRAGTGWRGPGGAAAHSAGVTDELREQLRTAGVPSPYLLTGHSLGGCTRATTRPGSPARWPACCLREGIGASAGRRPAHSAELGEKSNIPRVS